MIDNNGWNACEKQNDTLIADTIAKYTIECLHILKLYNITYIKINPHINVNPYLGRIPGSIGF